MKKVLAPLALAALSLALLVGPAAATTQTSQRSADDLPGYAMVVSGVLVVILFASIPAAFFVARAKNRVGLSWVLICFFLPFFGFILLLCLPRLEHNEWKDLVSGTGGSAYSGRWGDDYGSTDHSPVDNQDDLEVDFLGNPKRREKLLSDGRFVTINGETFRILEDRGDKLIVQEDTLFGEKKVVEKDVWGEWSARDQEFFD